MALGKDKVAVVEVEEADADSVAFASPTRTLHLTFDNWKWSKLTICDSDKTTQLYRVECHTFRKPHLVMHRTDAPPGAPNAGEGDMHTLTSRVDIRLHGQPFEFRSLGALKDGFYYNSPTLNGAKMIWKSKSRFSYFDLICLDPTGAIVARIEWANMSLTKLGKLELLDEKFVRGGVELVSLLS